MEEETRMPLLYYKDAVKSLEILFHARSPKSRIYNISGIAPTAKEIADTVKKYIPDARIRFVPKPEIVSVINNWPSIIDDREAQEELGWRIDYQLDPLVKDFIEEIRTARRIYE